MLPRLNDSQGRPSKSKRIKWGKKKYHFKLKNINVLNLDGIKDD